LTFGHLLGKIPFSYSRLLRELYITKDVMHKTALQLAAALGVLTIGLSAASPAFANEAEQSAEQSQEWSVECTSGAYGQSSICKSSGSQAQSLRQKLVLGVHYPVDAAVDATAMSTIALTGVAGIGAFAGYLKLRK
jgi:invasion protein IalB